MLVSYKIFGEAVLRSSPAAPAWEQLPLSYATNQIVVAVAAVGHEDGVRESCRSCNWVDLFRSVQFVRMLP